VGVWPALLQVKKFRNIGTLILANKSKLQKSNSSIAKAREQQLAQIFTKYVYSIISTTSIGIIVLKEKNSILIYFGLLLGK